MDKKTNSCFLVYTKIVWFIAIIAFPVVMQGEEIASSADEMVEKISKTYPIKKYNPKEDIEEYLSITLPKSAKHFWCHVESSGEDLVWAGFDVPKIDLTAWLSNEEKLPKISRLKHPVDPNNFKAIGSKKYWWAKDLSNFGSLLETTHTGYHKNNGMLKKWDLNLWIVETNSDLVQVRIFYKGSTASDAKEKLNRIYNISLPNSAQNVKCEIELNSFSQLWGYFEIKYSDLEIFKKGIEGWEKEPNCKDPYSSVEGLQTTIKNRDILWWKPERLYEAVCNKSKENLLEVAHFMKELYGLSMTIMYATDVKSETVYIYIYISEKQQLEVQEKIWRLVDADIPTTAQNIKFHSFVTIGGPVSLIMFEVPQRDLELMLEKTTLPKFSELKQNEEQIENMWVKGNHIDWWCLNDANNMICGRSSGCAAHNEKGKCVIHKLISICVDSLENGRVRVYFLYELAD
ncbi:MAG: hypothetical protein KAT56_05340 [Sedimentisphaerales bacterium]|nr:hypothetical protein [Sedimentisphaerales bacterium]